MIVSKYMSSSESSNSSNIEENLEVKPTPDPLREDDGWTTIPKKKPKRKRKVLRHPNLRIFSPLYEGKINAEHATLPEQRIAFVSKLLRSHGVKTILELGCGDLSNGIRQLRSIKQFTSITGVDIDALELKKGAMYALGNQGRPSKVRIFVGDATVPCKEWLPPPSHDKPPDAVIALEVVEHLDSVPLSKFPEAILGIIQPRVAILTTPNEDYNVVLRRVFGQLSFKDRFRHWDHRFEWNRQDITEWCKFVTEQYPEYKYKIEHTGIVPGTKTSDVRMYGRCSSVVSFVRDSTKPLRQVDWGDTKADIFL